MEQAPRRQADGFLAPPRSEEARNSIISNMSRFWRSRPAPVSSAASQGRPTKTFVVPLFLSASRSSGRNNLFARGALPAATRSRSSTRSVIDSEAPRPVIDESIDIHRPQQRERSDLYASSLQGDTVISSMSVPASVTDTTTRPTMSSRSGSTRTATSSRSGSHRTQSSRSSARSRQILSKRAYRDPQVNSKAKICFAFGLTLIVAVIICESSTTTLFAQFFSRANSCRSGPCFYWSCSQHHVPRLVNLVHHHVDGDILSPTHSHVHVD